MHIRDCFISHASEDKDAVARPLAEALKSQGYEVWFDEFELELGDSLPEKIDEGLTASRFGVVVLSKRFFEKNWTQLELNALVARQMVGSERIILPVWHEIDEDYLERVSPTLASIVGVQSTPLPAAVERIAKRIDRRRDSGSSGAALVAAQRSRPISAESDPEKLISRKERVRLGYSEEEKTRFHKEGGSVNGPGWVSVIVGPTTLEDDLIDPTEVSAEHLRDLAIEDQWYSSDVLLNRHGLKADLDGFFNRWPEQQGELPGYRLRIWQDGLMEFGETLSVGPMDERRLPYIALAQWIHDYVLLFTTILQEVGYRGDVVAVARLGDIKGFVLGLPRGAYFPDYHPFRIEEVQSRPLRASVDEMSGGVNRWVKKTLDRIFLAAGIATGAFFLDENGILDQYK